MGCDHTPELGYPLNHLTLCTHVSTAAHIRGTDLHSIHSTVQRSYQLWHIRLTDLVHCVLILCGSKDGRLNQ